MSHLAVDTKVYIKAVEGTENDAIPTFELLGGVDINDLKDGFPVGTFTVGTETNAPNVIHALDDLVWNGGAINGEIRFKCDDETLNKLRGTWAKEMSIGYRTDEKIGLVSQEIDVDEIMKNIERRFDDAGTAGTEIASTMQKVLEERRQYKDDILYGTGDKQDKPVGLLSDMEPRGKIWLMDSLQQLVDAQEEAQKDTVNVGTIGHVVHGTTPHKVAIVAALKALNQNIMVVGGHPDQLNPLRVDYWDEILKQHYVKMKQPKHPTPIWADCDGSGKGARVRRRQGFGGYGKQTNKKFNKRGRK